MINGILTRIHTKRSALQCELQQLEVALAARLGGNRPVSHSIVAAYRMSLLERTEQLRRLPD